MAPDPVEEPLHIGGGSRPIPDPTLLTGQLVDKAIANLEKVFETRIVGIERAIELIQADIRTRPEAIEIQVGHLQALHEEKFKAVEGQFTSLQAQIRDSKVASDSSVATALQAQKEAAAESAKSFSLSIDKSERATQEQITQQRAQIQTSTTNLDGKIDDLKERVTRIEGAAVGIVAAKNDTVQTHTATSQSIGTIIGVIGAVAIVLAIIERFVR